MRQTTENRTPSSSTSPAGPTSRKGEPIHRSPGFHDSACYLRRTRSRKRAWLHTCVNYRNFGKEPTSFSTAQIPVGTHPHSHLPTRGPKPAPTRARPGQPGACAHRASPSLGAGAACARECDPAARVLTEWRPAEAALAVTCRPRWPHAPIGSLPRGIPTEAEAPDAVRGSRPTAARRPSAHIPLGSAAAPPSRAGTRWRAPWWPCPASAAGGLLRAGPL